MDGLTRRCRWMVLALGLALGGAAHAQDSLRPEITRLERLPSSERKDFVEQINKVRSQARADSEEQFDLLFQLAMHHAGRKQRTELEALEGPLAAWRQSPNEVRRAQGELMWALAWTSYHLSTGHYALAQKEMDSIRPERLAALAPKWRYRERSMRAGVRELAGHADEAVLLRLDAVRLAAEMDEPWRRAYALSRLSTVYIQVDQIDKAKETIDEALKLAKQSPADHDLLSGLYNAVALIYQGESERSVARKALETALHHAKLAGDRGQQLLLMGNLADSYLQVGDFARALTITSEVIPLAQELGERDSELLALHNMGIAKIGLKRIAEGKADVMKVIAVHRQQGAMSDLASSWQELGLYLEKAGDYAGAVEAYEEYRRIADTLSRADQRKRVLEAQEKFDAERRSQETRLLEEQTKLQGEQIRARNLQLVQWGLLLASAVAAMVLMVMLFRRMRHANRELAQSNAELAVRSERDALTGLANRRYFQREVGHHEHDGVLKASLFLIDIDHFKRINDTHGHAGGDAVLVATAHRLRAAVREQDIVVRWGGEEFLILVSSREPLLTLGLAHRILKGLGGEPVALPNGQVVRVTASIGYASFPIPGGEGAPGWEKAIDVVDTLMYQAKGHGRNQAWGLNGARCESMQSLQEAMADWGAARDDGRLNLQVTPGPQRGGDE
ncbi:tetratricopeptide repeat-containing diguanylate cyclase [Inhella gelatinilytica]|uniref:diguanylate cyclase n=1 Tax=Inhella gelatinilytica TaxID=2795030 RepID=A0A931IXC9_9BURK|nr:GGDEF domain-containing protein [Inhella gelatinilytica]MBH9553632.1 diguanylate cyclase [Inhella gelatinilytica]